MQNNIDGIDASREDDNYATNRREAISVALVPWKPLEVEVFRHESRSSNRGIQSDETFEKLVIRELLAERREFYDVMIELRDFLRDIPKSKTINDAKSNESKSLGPCGPCVEEIDGCGEQPQCSESPAAKICNRRARFIRWYVNRRKKKALMRDKR